MEEESLIVGINCSGLLTIMSSTRSNRQGGGSITGWLNRPDLSRQSGIHGLVILRPLALATRCFCRAACGVKRRRKLWRICLLCIIAPGSLSLL